MRGSPRHGHAAWEAMLVWICPPPPFQNGFARVLDLPLLISPPKPESLIPCQDTGERCSRWRVVELTSR